MSNINVFLVQSPFQALNAIEAKSTDLGKFNIVIVYLTSEKKNNEQVIKIIERHSWDKIIFFPNLKNIIFRLTNIFFFLWINHLKYKGKVDTLWFGDFRSEWMHYCIKVYIPKQIYLLDDGLVTISIQNQYFAKNIYKPTTMQNKNFIKKFQNIFFKLIYHPFSSTNLNKPFNIFTIYKIKPLKNQKVLSNPINYLRSLTYKKEFHEDEVYYFGAPYYENSIVSFEFEINFLKFVAKHYKSKNLKFFYVQHRRESPKKLKYLKNRLGVKVLDPKKPAEIYFLEMKKYPKHIAGAYSSVLINLKLLINFKSITAFLIPENEISPRFRGHVSDLYKYMEMQKVNIFKISYYND